MRRMLAAFIVIVLALAVSVPAVAQKTTKPAGAAQPTLAEAEKFMQQAEERLNDLSIKASRASWVQSTFITDDTEVMAAEANERLIAATTELAEASRRFSKLKLLPPPLERKFMLLKLSLSLPAPRDAKLREELTRLATGLESDYGKGKYCRKGRAAKGDQAEGEPQDCLDITAIERVMATSRDPGELLDLWRGWRAISPPMRPRYARFVELANQGAREMGFKDVGAMWRSNYDMPPEQFPAELERLWGQVRPLYESLHAYVRRRLAERYGPQVVPPEGMIPAHLLGNPWAQEWGNIYPLVAPPAAKPSYDLDELLKRKNTNALAMVHYGENFFTSMGFAPLPKTFWERSMFTKPRDRDVVCHASAWTLDNREDLRLKMCIRVSADDFITVHHELGHNFYQRAYNRQAFLFQGGANDGFHEAVGDAVALAITPEYLKQVGLLERLPEQDDTAMLLRQAMDKVAFLPFGLLIDQWRWKVFSGEVSPADYNRAWWELRNRYQGVSAPVERTERDFDPGAKYHVPANVPYTRYFLARVLQFQFYRAMCRAAGHTGPLYRCSFFNNKEAGARLARMLEQGQSRPWQEALYQMTGERTMDAGALLEYFAPLKQWLDEQNRGQKVGWAAK